MSIWKDGKKGKQSECKGASFGFGTELFDPTYLHSHKLSYVFLLSWDADYTNEVVTEVIFKTIRKTVQKVDTDNIKNVLY